MGRTKGSKNLPWAAMIARLREHPDRWILLPEMRSVDIQMISIIRERRRRALHLPDGKIYCRQRAITQRDDGTIRCTLVLKFTPYPKEKDHGDHAT